MVFPSTAYGLAVLLILVIPGTVYAAVRTKVGGRGPHDTEVTARILWAILASAVLVATYMLIFGQWLVETFTFDGISERPRRAGFAGLALGIVVPATLAYMIHGRPNWKRNRVPSLPWLPWPQTTTGYESTPTAWDWAAPKRGGHWVRMRLDDGAWVGGWFGEESFVSTYPEHRDIFIQDQHVLDENGKIGEMVQGSAGVWLALADGHVVEWLRPDFPASESEAPNGRADKSAAG